MSDFQAAKTLVRRFHDALHDPDVDAGDALAKYMNSNCLWRGFHPFDELHAPDEIASRFWKPLMQSLRHLQRREDVFFAGHNRLGKDADVWVVSMGHLMGLFDDAFLGIPPTGKMAFLRYCEFHRVQGERIVETAMYFDLPHLMIQAGLTPFADPTAAHLVQPGPQTHDGLLLNPQPATEGDATQALINAMIADLGKWQGGLPLEEELRRTWAEDMIWWGPAGIGATYTIPRYAQQHAGPFRAGFRDRSATGHIARVSEGHYGGFFGYPNFTARPTGKALGLRESDTLAEFRVIDIYRRAGNKLAENWIFIDMLHMYKTQGIDILAQAMVEARP